MTSPVLARSISSASSSGRPSTDNRSRYTGPFREVPALPQAASPKVAPVRSGAMPDLEPTAGAGRVFRRSLDPDLPIAVEGHRSTIVTADGREYLDAAGGAVVVNVGHGRESIAAVLAEQAGRLSYAHGSAFTTEPVEAYARDVGPFLPMDRPAIYPVSGGSEAIESALKLVRAYHIARGEADRWI